MELKTKTKLNKILNISLTSLLGVAVFIFIITFSIGLPIYCRFFYYMQIESLGIPEMTGKSIPAIKFAYDKVLDFLLLPNTTFNAGVFRFSEEGASHFADCKKLFSLNTIALVISSVIIVALLILNKYKVIKLCKPFGFDVPFISAVSIFVFALILGGIVAIDFEKAFIVFHYIFFPGKTDWFFDPYYDEIILALPEQFFLNCAILIVASIVVLSIGIIVYQIIKKKKSKKH